MSDFSDPSMAQPSTQGPAAPMVPPLVYAPQFAPQPAYAMQATGWVAPPQNAGGTGEAFPPSSPAPLIAGLLVAIAGFASIIFYMALSFRAASGYLGLFPGLRTASYNHARDLSWLAPLSVTSAVVCGLAWMAVGLLIIFAARRRLTTIAIAILVLYGLLVLVSSIESFFYIQIQGHGQYTGGPIVGLVSTFVIPLALMAAVALLIPAGNTAARGADASGFRLAAIILLGVALAWTVGMEIFSIARGHIAAGAIGAWLLCSVALRVGLIVLAAGIGSGVRPNPYVQAPLAAPQMMPVTMPDGSQRMMPVLPQQITPQPWRP